MRNTPLKGLLKKSPMKSDILGSVVEGTKAAIKGASKKALGVVGAFIDPTTTSNTDQPGTGKHGGKKVKNIRNMIS